MQDVTPWPASFDVSEPVARVLVDGEQVDVESVTISSELDSAMPERVAAAGGGVVAATGSASILRSDDVAEAGFNPWGDAQTFVNASEVVVEAGYRDPATGGVGCARQITGQVDNLSGGATTGAVGLDFVDHAPSLDREITIEPLLRYYPSLDDFGTWRGAELYPLYVTDRVLRHCGFYATPPTLPGALLSATLMGSAQPERGTLISASNIPNRHLAAGFRRTPWGMGLHDGAVTYTPDLSSSSGRLTSTLHVSFHRMDTPNVLPNQSGHIQMLWGSEANAVRVVITDNYRIVVQYRVNGTNTNIATLQAADVQASEAFTVLVHPSGQAEIHASNGTVVTGPGTLPPVASTSAMSEIYVRVPYESHPIGGLQVAFSSNLNHTFERTAHLEPPTPLYSLEAFPSQIGVNCLALLKEQAEAELAAMWIDEFGHFQWRNRRHLLESPARGTLTSTEDLLDLPWRVPTRSVYSHVEIEHDTPVVTVRGVPAITVSDSRGSTLVNEDTEDRFFEPPADEDWHMVATPQWMGGTLDYARLRRGIGSYRGGIIVDDDDNERLAYSSRLHQTWAQLGPQRWLLSSEVSGLDGDEYIEQAFRDRRDLYGRFAEDNLPIIRAKAFVKWNQEKTGGTSRGPALAPSYVHPVGPWIQNPTELAALADWLADHLTKPDVVLRDVPIVPDPRVQLGDVFWLEDQTAYHVRARVVVMGKHLTYQATNSGHEMTQTITCRVIDIERLHVRYDELETTWEGRGYDALSAAWSGQDYDALEADPLDRS